MVGSAIVAVGLAALVLELGGSDSPGGGAEVDTLSEAAAQGDVDRARELLREGADPDEPRHYGFTPVMRAAIGNHVRMIELLLDAGADLAAVDPNGLTAWHLAARVDATEALEALMAAGADLGVRSRDGMNALDHAASAGSVDAIAVIAATGIDLDAQSETRTQGHGYPVDEGSTALSIAARAGQIEAVKTLLELGANVDAPSAFEQTPLLMAIVSGQPPELVSVLLDAGADPTVRARCRAGCSIDEGDALQWAHRLGHPGVIPLLEAAIAERDS